MKRPKLDEPATTLYPTSGVAKDVYPTTLRMAESSSVDREDDSRMETRTFLVTP